MLISTRDARKENLIISRMSLPGSATKRGIGEYNRIHFIAETTVRFRKAALLPKPVGMIIPVSYSQVRSKQLQLKWHIGNGRLSLLVAPVQADNRARLRSLPQVLNSLFCIQITQGYFSTEPYISLVCDKWICLYAKAMRDFLRRGSLAGAAHTTRGAAAFI